MKGNTEGLFLCVRYNYGLQFINQSSIIFLESQGKEVVIKYRERDVLKEIRIRDSLKRLEQKLDEQLFVRVHRSYIVNVFEILRVEASTNIHLLYLKALKDILQVSHSGYQTLLERMNMN
ncbi:LytR/AlgR family response regulator transcription factor [Shouchella sp. JSM 1781072]|uniref:LytR/AlgR family response regulator transcription factor n=1 Tax=Bacillaceae TaxID=186817 RepID=UPI000C0730E4|nr:MULTISPECIES: LytTR family DNA-binding domain-containing protein [Bacillaceae]UTR07041.1 LytTR family transcriptional regulator [Alkalihalobacillus sp. LMS6]